jgi:hypothetical protein
VEEVLMPTEATLARLVVPAVVEEEEVLLLATMVDLLVVVPLDKARLEEMDSQVVNAILVAAVVVLGVKDLCLQH